MAGHHDAIGARDLARVRGEADLDAERDERRRFVERALDGAQVPDPEVEEGDAEDGRAQRMPLVLGTPVTRGSIRTACARAFAKALNEISTM